MRGAPALRLLLPLLWSGVVWPRVVRVPAGPLLRVAGTEVTIPCNVTDYEGPREQNFEWKFSSGGDPAVDVLSTWDNTFTNVLYKGRVSSGGIQLQRVSNSVVLLRIQPLTPSDGGQYTCSTPSTDETYSGNYEDSVLLRVIPDTLQLTGRRGRTSRVLNITEGGSFQLQCQASSDGSSEHTHLSLTWEHQTAGKSPAEVLTLTHLGRLQAGSGYEGRYSSGEVHLDTSGTDVYQLNVEGARPQDAGEYSCVAKTWVQGPEGWEKIQEKRVDVTRVEVRPIGLSVTVPASSVASQEGDPLHLTCIVSQDSDAPVLTLVRWFLAPAPFFAPEETRELLGGQNPDPPQEGASTHILEVPHVWDSGDITCRATVWAVHRNGTWFPAAEKTSTPVRVVLINSVPEFEVTLNVSRMPQFSEEPTELLCHVTGAGAVSLSVSWHYTPALPPAAPSQLLGSLDQDGTLQTGPGSEQRLEKGDLLFFRRDPQTFVLRIQWTSEADRGSYYCVGKAWERQRNDSWVQSKEVTSRPVNVFWAAQEPILTVSAKLTKLVSAAGGTFEMRCGVTSRHIASPWFSVQVIMEGPSPDKASVPVIALSRDGVVMRAPGSGGDVILEKEEKGLYLFRLYRAQIQDAGAYRCSIAAWTQGGGGNWREVQSQVSNPVQLGFQSSGLLFNVTALSDSPAVYRNERAEFWCIITFQGPAADPEDLAFEVSWFAQHLGRAPVLLGAVDRAAQVRQSQRNSSSEIALERVSDMEFRLRVYNCEEQDAGGHYCTVTPWVRSGEGGWIHQDTITSNIVSLSVRMDLLSAFRYPLLIGAGLALAVGLLSCLIGYCSTRFCCKAPPIKETRREHRRLMSMEMD